MNSLKENNVKNCTYYYFDDMSWSKQNQDRRKVIQKYSIYYTGYVTIKDLTYVKIKSVNPLYVIINKINGDIEAYNGNIWRYFLLMKAKTH